MVARCFNIAPIRRSITIRISSPPRVHPDPKNAQSAEQSYVEGLAFDKKSKERDARAAYTEALKRDPGFAPAHIALGLSFYRSGEYETAARHLEAALVRNKDAGDAHYYLALVQTCVGPDFRGRRSSDLAGALGLSRIACPLCAR